MQAKHDKLAAWFVSHGGYLDPAVEFAFDQSCGVFLRHKADREDDEHTLQIKRGSVIVSCPHNITLSALNVVSDLCNLGQLFPCDTAKQDIAFPQSIKATAPRPQCLAALWLCVQLNRGASSSWAPYIDLLPKSQDFAPIAVQEGPDLPLWWEPNEQGWVDGSPLAKGFRDLESWWRSEYEQWYPELVSWAVGNGIDISWQHYKWALSILTSRAFQSSLIRKMPNPFSQTTEPAVRHPRNATKQPATYDAERHASNTSLGGVQENSQITPKSYQQRNGTSRGHSEMEGADCPREVTPSVPDTYDPDMLLYPGIDILNHSPHTKNYWVTNEHAYSIICEDDVNPGDQIFNCYGARNNGQLLLSYGFALENNPHDAFPLKLPPQDYPLLHLLDPGYASLKAEYEPSRLPEATDPTLTTFYVRDPLTAAASVRPGYPLWGAMPSAVFQRLTEGLTGIPLALIARLTCLLMNSSDRIRAQTLTKFNEPDKPNRFTTPTCCLISLHVALAVTSLLLDRLRMERTRLDAGLANLLNAAPESAQACRRHTAAKFYMTGQAAILEHNIFALEQAVSTVFDMNHDKGLNRTSSLPSSISYFADHPHILTLPLAYQMLDSHARVWFDRALALLTDTPVDHNDNVHVLFRKARVLDLEEDLWALLFAFVRLTPPENECSMQARWQAWCDHTWSFHDEAKTDEDEDTIVHVIVSAERVAASYEGAGHEDAERMQAEAVKDDLPTHCVRVVREATVRVTMREEELARIEERESKAEGQERKRGSEGMASVLALVLEGHGMRRNTEDRSVGNEDERKGAEDQG